MCDFALPPSIHIFGIPQAIAIVIGIVGLLWARGYIYQVFTKYDRSQSFAHKRLLFHSISIAIMLFGGLALITFVLLAPTGIAMNHWYDQQSQHLLANHCSFDDLAKLGDASVLHEAHSQFYQISWPLIVSLNMAFIVLLLLMALTLILTSRNADPKEAAK